MSDLTSITYDSDNNVVSYYEDGVLNTIQRDKDTGQVLSIASGYATAGQILVPNYDENGLITSTDVVPWEHGLTVLGSQLLHNGKIYRGLGINFYDVLDHTDYAAQLLKLKNTFQVPFIRMNMGQFACGAAPNTEWRKYLDNKAGWWALRDNFMAAAEVAGIGVIASVFWRYQTIPDLMLYKYGKRDALDQWGVSTSNTRKFMRDYLKELVPRYKESPSLWGWEFCNETNLFTDWTNGAISSNGGSNGGPSQYLSVVDPATTNGSTDYIKFSDYLSLAADFTSTIRSMDTSGRLITSGNSISGPLAWSRIATVATGVTTGSNYDTYNQWMGKVPVTGSNGVVTLNKPIPLLEHPPGFNAGCAHMYQEANVVGQYGSPFFIDQDYTEAQFIGLVNKIFKDAGIVFYLGEWGALIPWDGTGQDVGDSMTEVGQIALFTAAAGAIVSNKISLASIWNYGYIPAVPAVKNWNIDEGTNRQYQLNAVAVINKQLSP